MIETREEIETYRSQFVELEKSLDEAARAATGWLHPVREKALERFSELGFPSTKDEEWRFTNVAPLAQKTFRLARAVAGDGAALERVLPPAFRALDDEPQHRIVVVNGRYAPRWSAPGSLPEGAIVTGLADAAARHRDLVEAHLTRAPGADATPFAWLNTAFVVDGVFVYLPDGTILDRPLHVVFVHLPEEGPTVCHPRLLVVAGASAQARIVESWCGPPQASYFTNAVTEIFVGRNAVVDHAKLGVESDRADHLATLAVRLERDATFRQHSLALGGGLVRNDIRVELDGPGTDATLNGLYVLAGTRHVDHHTVIDHAAPHGTSRELYKGILDGKARAVFNGRIIVRPGAQKTDASQTNKNLLLSREALVNTNPQLEIHADDVKCAHGATIGQIDPDALFYLRTRGLDEATARGLLVSGFMSDVIERIDLAALRRAVEETIAGILPFFGDGGHHAHGE